MARLSLAFLALCALCCVCQVVLGSAVPKSPKALSGKNSLTSKHHSTSNKFCDKFTKECYNVALKGKTGNIKVIHQCERHGKKHSRSYSFGCKADKNDVTKQVLENIGQDHVVTTTTKSVKTSSVTATASTTTKTQTTSSTVTTIVATLPVVQVAVTPTSLDKRSKIGVDKSVFCSAFSNGCQSRCTEIKSAVKAIQCHSTSQNHYSLACQCKSGKMETQHALYAAAGKQKIETISTMTTSYKTVSTVKPVTTVTENLITTVKATATSTTNVILAPTGAVKIYSTDEQSMGYLSYLELLVPSEFNPEPQSWMAVQDEQTKLYQLTNAGNPGLYLGIHDVYDFGSTADFTNKEAYGVGGLYQADQCGLASYGPGQASGSAQCESYVFGFKGDEQTLEDGTANVTMQWYNPNALSSKEYTWVIDSKDYLAAVSDPKVAKPDGNPATQVFLRYPIPIPDSG